MSHTLQAPDLDGVIHATGQELVLIVWVEVLYQGVQGSADSSLCIGHGTAMGAIAVRAGVPAWQLSMD